MKQLLERDYEAIEVDGTPGTMTFTVGGATATVVLEHPEEAELDSDAPALVRSGGPTLVLVNGVLDALTLAKYSSDVFTIAAFTRTEQLRKVDLVANPATTTIVVYLPRPVSPATDREQWNLATEVLRTIGSAVPTRTTLVTGVHGGSWADYLANREDAAGAIEMKLSTVAKVPSKPPAARKVDGSTDTWIVPIVDWTGGEIYEYAKLPDGTQKRAPLLTAAVRISKVRQIIDDMNALDVDGAPTRKNLLFDLEVAVGSGATQKTYELKGVAADKLRNIHGWLNRLPDAAGATVILAPGEVNKDRVANAIKAHEADLTPHVVEYQRTGWVHLAGEWHFLHAQGAISERGETGRSRAVLSPSFRTIAFPDPATVDVRMALGASLSMQQQLVDPTAWFATFGTAMHSVANLGIGAVPFPNGIPDSGKTALLHGLNSHLTTKFSFGGQPMAKIDRSAANTRSLGAGLQNLWFSTDDFRDRKKNSNAESEQDASIEDLIRRGFETGSGRTVRDKDPETGEWVDGVPEATTPAVLLAGERIPDSEEVGQRSTVERLLPIRILKGQFFHDADEFVAIAKTNLPQQALAVFIQWLAQQIGVQESMEAWQVGWATVRSAVEDVLKDHLNESRVSRVTAVPATGMRVWFQCLLELGVIDEAERAALVADVDRRLMQAAKAHIAENLTQSALHRVVLDALRDQADTDAYYIWRPNALGEYASPVIGERELKPLARMLGQEIRPEAGEAFIAIKPAEAIKATRGRFATAAALAKALAPITIKDEHLLTRQTRFADGSRVRSIAIPVSVWNE